MEATKRLQNLWLKFNKKCFWCRIETILPKKGTDSQLWATRDHLFHRKDNRRYTHTDGSGIVLACGFCNVERGNKNHWKRFWKKDREKYEKELAKINL
jgi:hypothetical protein